MRSFPEFIKYLKQGFEEAGYVGDTADFDCGPTEPIPSVGEAFQIEVNADTFYKEVLYPGVSSSSASGWSPSFHWREMIQAYNAEGQLIEGEEDFTLEEGLVTKPTRQYFKEFRSYDAAMAYVSRPACTLRQYIELRHGKSISKLVQERYKVQGQDTSYYSSVRDKGRGKVKGGATFWARIDAYKQGPGSPDDEVIQKVTNVGPEPDFGPHPSGSWDILTGEAGIPQTRRNWDKMLQLYRRVVYGELSRDKYNPLKFVAPQV